MAQLGVDPVPATPSIAIEAFERDLDRVLRGKTLEEMGWERPDRLTLLIPLLGARDGGQTDPYLLRLHFGYYPEWPPSAQFVNPETGTYLYPGDVEHLPRIEETGEIRVHPAYKFNDRLLQLICCSATLEFYLVRHGGEAHHVWQHPRQNFSATLKAIERGLGAPWYKGPHPRQGT